MTTAIRESDKRVEAPSYRQLNVRLPAELFAILEEAARRDHRSLSSAVAVSVARWARTVRHQDDVRI
jgi:predicted HicB family RNase H-like nuclease